MHGGASLPVWALVLTDLGQVRARIEWRLGEGFSFGYLKGVTGRRIPIIARVSCGRPFRQVGDDTDDPGPPVSQSADQSTWS